MKYSETFGWPCLYDFQGYCRWLEKEVPADQFQLFRAAVEWLDLAMDCCGGKRSYVSLPIIKKLAEGFIGPLSDDCFLVAAYAVTNRNDLTKDRPFNHMVIKVPVFDVKKIEVAWKQHEAEVEERQAAQTAEVNEGGTNGGFAKACVGRTR